MHIEYRNLHFVHFFTLAFIDPINNNHAFSLVATLAVVTLSPETASVSSSNPRTQGSFNPRSAPATVHDRSTGRKTSVKFTAISRSGEEHKTCDDSSSEDEKDVENEESSGKQSALPKKRKAIARNTYRKKGLNQFF